MKLVISFYFAIFSIAALAAQDAPAAPDTYLVTKGLADVAGTKYPVYGKIDKVEAGSIGGIRYEIKEKNAKSALAKAAAVRGFYQGKKLAGAKLGKFAKSSKPDTIAWSAVAGKEPKAFGVVVKIDGESVVVYVIPEFSEGSLAQVL